MERTDSKQERVLSAVHELHDLETPVTSTQIDRARHDARLQESMSPREALRRYPQAVFWSLLLSSVTIMESYDYGLMGNFFGLPAFQRHYGQQLPSGKYNVSAADQTVLKQVTKAGQVAGLLITGLVVDRIGFKRTQLCALTVLVPVILLQFFAPNKDALVAAQTLIGVPLAAFLTLANVYAAEVSPLCLRPYLTTFTQVCWVVGGLISTGILRGFVTNTTRWAYRIPFAIQLAWIPLFAIAVVAAPESPQWLIKKGRMAKARRALDRLASKGESEDDRENRLAYMAYVNAQEAEQSSSSSYLDCFRGVNLRRTEVACIVYAIQPMCGYALANNATYFFQIAGLSPANSFNISLGNQGLSLVCTLASWPLMAQFGRRPMMLFGLVVAFISLVLIGGLSVSKPSAGTSWATGAATYIFAIGYSGTIGPLAFLLITDIPNTRLRHKTAVLARSSYICWTLFNVIITNYQINATAWAWKGKAGFFWAGSCALCILWTYFRLPETRNRLTSELDTLFHRGVPARQFRDTKVEAVE